MVIIIYAKVKAGTVITVGLPPSGVLSDGRSVSNYSVLPLTILAAEGWLPFIDNPPVFDPATHQMTTNGYTITAIDVTALYTISPRPPLEITVEVNSADLHQRLINALPGNVTDRVTDDAIILAQQATKALNGVLTLAQLSDIARSLADACINLAKNDKNTKKQLAAITRLYTNRLATIDGA